MNSLTPGQVVLLIIGGALALAGFINTVGAAIEKVAKLIKVAKAPNDAQDKRLADLEARQIRTDEYLRQDKERLESIEKSNAVTQRALLALLGHGLHGNNVEQMQASETELQNHLINR